MDDDVLLSETAGGVRTLTLNRPAARNALSADLITRLSAALGQAEADDGVAAVVLTGTDPAFCAGLDLREVGAGGIDPGFVLDLKRSPWWVLGAMRTPVIGAINGPAIPAGASWPSSAVSWWRRSGRPSGTPTPGSAFIPAAA